MPGRRAGLPGVALQHAAAGCQPGRGPVLGLPGSTGEAGFLQLFHLFHTVAASAHGVSFAAILLCFLQADLVKPRQAVGSGAAEATPSGGGGESPAGAASATVGPNGGGGSGRHGHSSAAPAGAAETVGSGTGRAGSHAAAGTSDQDGGAAAGPIGGGPLDGSSRSGGVGRAGGGMRPLGVQVSEPRRFAVHSYAGLLPMPRVAMLSGLTEMEWVGICELWDTTGEVQTSVGHEFTTFPML